LGVLGVKYYEFGRIFWAGTGPRSDRGHYA
jgi:hypothetical protein